MSKQKEIYSKLPNIIRSILIISDGWLVGSAIESIISNEVVNDYDIIVPPQQWEYTMVHLKEYPYTLNTFGGMKFTIDDMKVDIWPQDTDRFLKVAIKFTYAFNLKHQILIRKEV